MKIKGKKYMLGIFIFIGLLIVVNLIEGRIDINQSDINECIDQYLKNKDEEGKVKIVSYEQLGNDKYGIIINQYSLINEDVYNEIDGNYGNLEFYSGIIHPARFKIVSFLGFKKVIWCSYPTEGEFYEKSLSRLFPKDILDKLDENFNDYSTNLQQKNREKLKEIRE